MWPHSHSARRVEFKSAGGKMISKMNAGLILRFASRRDAQNAGRKMISKMNAGLILRVASRRDAQNERDGAGLRSSVAAATPSHLRR